MTNIVIWRGITVLDLPAERILESAKEKNLKPLVVLGYNADGEFYFASTVADGGDVIWLLETAKMKLLQTGGVVPSA